MKRIIVSLSLILLVGSTTLFAKDKTDVNDKIKESFKKEFSGAELVKWERVKDYQKATFGYLGHRVIAFFNQDGELLGSLRDILFDQLPMAVIKSFDIHYAGADFIEIHEITNLEGTRYRLTMETQNKRFHVKTDTDGNILEVVKIK